MRKAGTFESRLADRDGALPSPDELPPLPQRRPKPPKIVDHFLEYLRYERRYSEGTLREYASDLAIFRAFLTPRGTRKALTTATQEDVSEFVQYMAKTDRHSAIINRRLSSLCSFYRFCVKRKFLAHNPVVNVDRPKLIRPLPHYLDEENHRRFIAHLESIQATKPKWYTFFTLLLYSGLRVSEGCGLEKGDLLKEDGKYELRVRGKGNKERIVPLPTSASEALAQWMDQQDGRYIFPAGRGNRPLSRKTVYCAMHRELKAAGLPPLSPHKMRHSYARWLLRKKAPLVEIQKFLGHEDIRTTQIYISVATEDLRKRLKMIEREEEEEKASLEGRNKK